MHKSSTRSIVLTGLFTAIIAALSQIAITSPSGVPITLQAFAIALTGYFLGYKKGCFAVLTYILIGAVGAPVFANFYGGLSAIIGVTGGFLWGFVLMALLCGLRKWRTIWLDLFLGVIGLLLCHLCGILQYAVVSHNTLFQSFLTASVWFLPKDILSVAAAYFVTKSIRRALEKSNMHI